MRVPQVPILMAVLLASGAGAQSPGTLAAADALWSRGRLAAADSAFSAIIRTDAASRRVATVSLAEIAEQTGQRDRSRLLAGTVTTEYERSGGTGWSATDLVALGRAWVLVSASRPDAVRQALAAFDAAAARDPANVDAPLRAADLLLDKFNAPDAKEGFTAVARRDPANARAQLGLARVMVFEGKPEATDAAEKALALDPTSVSAALLLGRLHLEAERYDTAAALARRAVAEDASAVGGWALLGAIAWLHGDTVAFNRAEIAARAINPNWAEFLAEVAEAAARHRRYGDAARFGAMAVALDSGSTRALAVLATNELRLGQMESGRRHAERAFALDPYNLWQKNTLDLLDAMRSFVTIESPRFRVVAPPQDADFLRLYLVPLLEQAYDTLAVRYGYRPPTPVRLEAFRRHADFSVRTVGLTGLGALGVSFGGVLVMDAPASRPPGEFNYASTAWHELTHTFTLGLSDNRVPRWISEGLSVLEERRTHRGWGADVSPDFLGSFKAGKLRQVSEINEGLVRPRHPSEIGHSYYEASLVCEMIEEQFGVEALRALLRAYRDGKDTPAAFQQVLRITPEVLEQRFAAWLKTKFAVPLANIDPWDGSGPVTGEFVKTLSAAHEAAGTGQLEVARQLFERADKLFPGYAGNDAPAIALAAFDSSNALAAAARLATVTSRNETALDANRVEARLRLRGGDLAGSAAALERLIYIDPINPAVHQDLADLAERLGDWPRVVRERRAIVALGPADRAEARFQLARALAKSGDRTAARREVLQLLEQAPGFEKAQELLLELRAATPSGGGE
ncbi:MAG: tetratricopeptide repeat protein [Gemmatimonadales bacterium]